MKSLLLVLITAVAYTSATMVYSKPKKRTEQLPLCPTEVYETHCQKRDAACYPTVNQVYFDYDFRSNDLKTVEAILDNDQRCTCLCGKMLGEQCDFGGTCMFPAMCSSDQKCILTSIFSGEYPTKCFKTNPVKATYVEPGQNPVEIGTFDSQCHMQKYLYEVEPDLELKFVSVNLLSI
ncbi:hypothetical protein LSH36_275g07041 [Paralvinella palmiformis]|uniref:Uncharacterized protein n=1 Tax=Paralvinella palmiformis TaxID=53620 RepID=A0AAD9JL11_9ANNE|nr:hypothetical protein LSH36_275g07041 [Paralvinella palmiformis]